ncbi:RNA-directed DNA polymerase, eukaryota, reverse transcriptase zinc-binding domain protein [Tanacetum coccineum]
MTFLGYATIDVEYEWNPPRCATCLVFDHHSDKCPKLPKAAPVENVEDDGFVEVKKKKHKSDKGESSLKAAMDTPINELNVSNSFSILETNDDEGFSNFSSKKLDEVLNPSDEEVDEELLIDRNGNVTSTVAGASTPVNASHIKDSNLQRLCSLVFRHWDWTSNGAWCNKGTRIIMGWNRNDVDVVVIDQNDQYTDRRSLWMSLCKHTSYIRKRPWSIMGDFNASLFIDESTACSSKVDIAMREFRDCVDVMEMSDVQCTGLQFTWNQKPQGGIGVLKKLDRIMANDDFRDQFRGAHAIFKPYRVSDHSPAVLCIPSLSRPKPKPFKLFNVVTSHEKFLDVVKAEW